MNPSWNNEVVRDDLNAHNFGAHAVGDTLDHLDTLIEQGRAIDARELDTRTPVAAIQSIDGKLTFPVAGSLALSPMRLTDHAWGQMLHKLGAIVFKGNGAPRLALELSGVEPVVQDDDHGARTMPKRYLQAVPIELLDTILNYHFSHAPNGRAWWMRAIEKRDNGADGGAPINMLRAVCGPRYPVDYGNTALLETVKQLIQKHADKFPQINLVRPALDDDELHARVVYYNRRTDDGDYGVGFYLGNNEIGQGAYDVCMLLQRTACTNSIIVDRSNAVHVIHAGSSATIREQIYVAIGTALQLGDELIDEFLRTREVPIPDFADVIDGLSLKYGDLLDQNVRGIVKEAAPNQGGATKFGLINGLTYAAHSAQDVTARNRAELERFAGALIATPLTLFGKAAADWRRHQSGDDPLLNYSVVTRYGNGGENED